MINQAQKIDFRAFVFEKYFRIFRNRLIQRNQKRSLSCTLPFSRRGLYGHCQVRDVAARQSDGKLGYLIFNLHSTVLKSC